MNEPVSISWMMGDTTLIKSLTADIVADSATNQLAIDAMRPLRQGLPVLREMCPRVIWGDADQGTVGRLPHLFDANGYYVVSGSAADILRVFNLGEGALYPVQIFQSDKTTAIPGDWHCWIFGNQKRALIPGETTAKRKFGISEDVFSIALPTPDYGVAVAADAVGGADVWCDPTMFKSVFFSSSLSQACDAKMAKDFRMARCKML